MEDDHNGCFDSTRSRFSADIIHDAKEHLRKRKEKESHDFWHLHPSVNYQLKTVPTLRELDVPLHLSKKFFLTRLFFPISSQVQTPEQIYKSLQVDLASTRKPLNPTDPKVATIMQTLRFLISVPKIKDRVVDQLHREESDITCFQDEEESNTFTSLILRSIACPFDVPAKEEALYFVAYLAVTFPEVLSRSTDVYLDYVLAAFVRAFKQVDQHITDRRNAKEKHELDMMTIRFQLEAVTRFLQPTFSYKRFRHAGSWVGHRIRSISILTAAIIMHYWRDGQLARTLAVHCVEAQNISRLHLVTLLHIVLEHWPQMERKQVVERLLEPMKKFQVIASKPEEMKKTVNLVKACIKRYRTLKHGTGMIKPAGSTFDRRSIKRIKSHRMISILERRTSMWWKNT